MKKFLRSVISALCLCFAFLSAGCRGCNVDMNHNDRSTAIYYPPRADGGYYYYNLSYDRPSEGNRYIRVDEATGESSFFVNESGTDGYVPGEAYDEEREVWTRQDGDMTYEYRVPAPPVIVNGRDNGWRGYAEVSEENYKILKNLTEKYERDGAEFIHVYLLDGGDGTAYGFVNVYGHSTGLLFSGGTAGVSGISYGVFIKYLISSDETEELLRVDGGCITAFDRDTVMFFKNEKYYSQNLGQEAKYLCDDLAYDRGITGCSFSFTLFNEVHFVLFMHADDGKSITDYAYIIGADGNLISCCESRGG